MSVPLSERTVELQFTDVCDTTLENRIASLLVGIVSKLSVEEIESLINEETVEQTE